ncbi:MAG TPA: GNAT family N-acetyltransferase [Aggregatilineales bacterium]|nr:GNAT family N-acetyltransferase [Aggregatilineales bacterium]
MAVSILFRDGLERDIPACLALDHTYETDTVWQMDLREQDAGWFIQFRPQRLPRTLETVYPANENRLKLAASTEHGFIVACERESGEVLGYLALSPDYFHAIGQIHDIVISRPLRRNGVGSGLLRAARAWAHEHSLTRLTLETRPQNYPSIQFAQAQGFAFCGFSDHHFQDKDIAVFLTRTI